MKHPAISVIMPVYNAEVFVAEAIESVLAQTYRDFEFIIINDGSTDGSLAIIQQYADKDQRIRLVSRENRGLVPTLNEGLQLAQSDLIARMDADDYCYPDRFLIQKKFMDAHPEVNCLGGHYEVTDDAGRVLTKLDIPTDDATLQALCLKGRTPINHPAVMMRKSAVLQVGGYQEEYKAAQDLDLWLKLGEIGKLANVPEVILQYRYATSSISGKNADLQKACALKACQTAWARRGITDTFEGGDWRPSEQIDSQYSFLLRFGWWAFNYRQRKTAIIYGFKAISLLPFKIEGWRLLVCALVKPLPSA